MSKDFWTFVDDYGRQLSGERWHVWDMGGTRFPCDWCTNDRKWKLISYKPGRWKLSGEYFTGSFTGEAHLCRQCATVARRRAKDSGEVVPL